MDQAPKSSEASQTFVPVSVWVKALWYGVWLLPVIFFPIWRFQIYKSFSTPDTVMIFYVALNFLLPLVGLTMLIVRCRADRVWLFLTLILNLVFGLVANQGWIASRLRWEQPPEISGSQGFNPSTTGLLKRYLG